MRVEPYSVGSYMHTIKRGARGLPITLNDADRWRFVRSLYYLNDEFFDDNWFRQRTKTDLFLRPDTWPSRRPLVKILCYTLMPNHVHLLLQEIKKGGVSQFMRKLGQSMTNYFNAKHNQKGSIFQGSYKGRTVVDDDYLRYVATYIMVKNVFELYPNGGLKEATKNFESAWEWGAKYQFSSLGDYASIRENSFIIEKGVLKKIWEKPQEFKIFSRDVIRGGKWEKVELE